MCVHVHACVFLLLLLLLWRAEIGANDDTSVKTPTQPDSLVNN